jgi:hypothetical protein
MADTGILTASSLISDGTIFTNPQNARVSDGVYATVSLGAGDFSEGLYLATFSPNIPITATSIDGFEPLVRGFASVEGVVFGDGWIINPTNVTVLSDEFITGFLTTSNGYVSAGGPTDLLGYFGTLTPTFVNNNTALLVYMGANSAASVSIDAIQLRIYYTPAASVGVSSSLMMTGCGS